jgi:hypothetical protein
LKFRIMCQDRVVGGSVDRETAFKIAKRLSKQNEQIAVYELVQEFTAGEEIKGWAISTSDKITPIQGQEEAQ